MWSLGSSSTDHEALTAIVTGCSTSNHTDYLSHDKETWIQLQEAHDRVKGRYATDWHIGGHSRLAQGGAAHIPHTGMMVPFEVKVNPKNGLRQVMVTRDVPEGFRIWKPLHYHTFQSEHGYVEFLQELPHHLQCEALSWTHASWMNEDEESYVDITLDEGTFIQETSNPDDINIDIDCVAVRHIKAGEFVYIEHPDYIPETSGSSSRSSSLANSQSGVEWFDEIRLTAWKRTGLGMGRSATHRIPSHHESQHGIAPGAAVLSALYVVAKLLKGATNRKPSPKSYGFDDDGFYGASFAYSQKAKLA